MIELHAKKRFQNEKAMIPTTCGNNAVHMRRRFVPRLSVVNGDGNGKIDRCFLFQKLYDRESVNS